MKKIYQIPEIDVVILASKISILDGSPGEIGEIDANQNKTFDEDELSTDLSTSGLWDD